MRTSFVRVNDDETHLECDWQVTLEINQSKAGALKSGTAFGDNGPAHSETVSCSKFAVKASLVALNHPLTSRNVPKRL